MAEKSGEMVINSNLRPDKNVPHPHRTAQAICRRT